MQHCQCRGNCGRPNCHNARKRLVRADTTICNLQPLEHGLCAECTCFCVGCSNAISTKPPKTIWCAAHRKQFEEASPRVTNAYFNKYGMHTFEASDSPIVRAVKRLGVFYDGMLLPWDAVELLAFMSHCCHPSKGEEVQSVGLVRVFIAHAI